MYHTQGNNSKNLLIVVGPLQKFYPVWKHAESVKYEQLHIYDVPPNERVEILKVAQHRQREEEQQKKLKQQQEVEQQSQILTSRWDHDDDTSDLLIQQTSKSG